MKPTNSTLNALLASRQFYKVDLYTLTLIDGTISRYCAGDLDITVGGNVYSAGGQTGPYFDIDGGNGGRIHLTTGLEADTFQVDVIFGSATLLGLPFLVACRYGVLDGATLRRDVAIMPTYGDVSAGLVFMFLGRITEIDILDQTVSLNLNSYKELLNQQLPRNLFSPGCMNTLFDASCTILQTAYQTAAVIGAGSTKSLLLLSGPAQVANYFTLGKVIFASGLCNGEARSIKNWAPGSGGTLGTAAIWPPLPVAPLAGDTLNIYPGCNKSPTDVNGCVKFANIANFRGFPDIPVPETSL